MKTEHFPYARWHNLPLESVTLTDGFWSRWQTINREVSLQHGFKMLEQAGNFDNLRIAAGSITGKYRGPVFMDSDVYKWLEAVGYELHLHPNADLQKQADGVIELIAAAQLPDGYINSHIQVVKPDSRWADLDFGHELYCAGHMFQGAVAYAQGTGTTRLLDIATRFADLIAATFGPDKRQGTCGHPEIEMALVELYRTTGKQSYLDLAKFFIDQRGKGVMRGLGWMKAEYHQDRVPVRDEDIVEGHAVRAMYLNAGVADLFLETGEQALVGALDREWHDMVGGKLFITGGLGARYEGESFGAPYELPTDRCYCETCAAIGSVMWNWRMLLITGESRFADLLERQLYNGVLSGLALDGSHYFYMNPLLSRGGYARKEWYYVACCPPNLMRLLASLGQYFATASDNGLQIHLYNTASINADPISVSMKTEYPWQGRVVLTIDKANGSPWQLRLRIPEWIPTFTLTVNGQTVETPKIESGYAVLDQNWQAGDVIELTLAMKPELIEAHPRIDAVRDSVAIQRGPLIYCVEGADHPNVDLMDIRLSLAAPLETVRCDDFGADSVITVQASGQIIEDHEWQGRLYRPLNSHNGLPAHSVPLTAIPYYVWANRGANAMRVWIPSEAIH